MTRTSLDCGVGLADSEFKGYSKDESRLKVHVRAWNDTNILFVFDDVVRVLDNGVGEISDACLEMSPSEFMSEALRIEYETIPETHPYKEFVFLDIDDCPALIVVAAAIEVTSDAESTATTEGNGGVGMEPGTGSV